VLAVAETREVDAEFGDADGGMAKASDADDFTVWPKAMEVLGLKFASPP
jgi:hypothetical protein